MKFFTSVFLCVFLFSCSQREEQIQTPAIKQVQNEIERILPLYDSIDPNNPGSWLANHKEEYISLEDYIKGNPVKADNKRNVIYIKPIGIFDTSRYNVLDMAAQFLSVVYHKRVQVLPAIMPDTFPTSAFRKGLAGIQMHTQFVMKKYLRPTIPADAVVYIALTTVDLYPEDSWNFVFGQSSLRDRVGVWSVNRLCIDAVSSYDTLCLRRTLKIAAHEVGHLFTIKHCKNFHCIMNGSLSMDESDSKPIYFCPECLQKLCWNNGQSLQDHFFRLKKFWEMLGD
jgi:archaemetzincin